MADRHGRVTIGVFADPDGNVIGLLKANPDESDRIMFMEAAHRPGPERWAAVPG